MNGNPYLKVFVLTLSFILARYATIMATETGFGLKDCLSLLSLGWNDFRLRRHGVDDSSHTETPECMSKFIRGSMKRDNLKHLSNTINMKTQLLYSMFPKKR